MDSNRFWFGNLLNSCVASITDGTDQASVWHTIDKRVGKSNRIREFENGIEHDWDLESGPSREREQG